MSTHSNSSGSGTLDFQITRNSEDEELEFTPSKGSRELRDALHYQFPVEVDYESRLQRAIMEFCGWNDRETFDFQVTRNAETEGLEFSPEERTKELRDALHYHLPVEKDYSSRIQLVILAIRKAEENPLEHSSTERVHTASSITSVVRTLTRQSSSLSSRTPSRQGSNFSSGSRPRRRKFNASERREIFENRGNVCEKHKRNRGKCDPDKCKDNLQFNARQAARHGAARATQATNSSPVPPNLFEIGNLNREFYSSSSFGISEPNLLLAQPSTYSVAPVGHSSWNGSGYSLPIMQDMPPAPQSTGLAADFYDCNLPVPQTLPSNGFPETQIKQSHVASHENNYQVDYNLDDFVDPQSYGAPAGVSHKDIIISPKPGTQAPRRSKSWPLAAFRRTLSRLFEAHTPFTKHHAPYNEGKEGR